MAIAFGRYELLKRIAAGGMGEVFLARQAGLSGFEKLLVIKVMLPHLIADEEARTSFLDEARIAARLAHPNIVQIFDLGQVGDMFYIAMEHVHGESLHTIAASGHRGGRRFPLELAVRIIADAAAGIDYAHKATDNDQRSFGLVHRDISPHNILVSFEGSVKVIDFGIAKATGRGGHTKTGLVKGKSAYMSPEQLHQQPLDGRADIFALGIVFFELVTGTRLFKRDTEIEMLRAVIDCQVPRPTTVNPEVDPILETIMLQALAKERDNRFRDAAAMRLALEDWLVLKQRPSSAAHLATHLQKLFAERLEAERATGRPFLPDEGTPTSIFGSLGRPLETTEKEVPRRKPPRRIGLYAPLAILLALGGAWAVLRRERPTPAPAPAVQLPAAPEPAAVSTVTLNLSSRPLGATVVVDGVVSGRTPLALRRMRDAAPFVCEVRLDGYKRVAKQLVADRDQDVQIVLERERQARDPALDIKLDR